MPYLSLHQSRIRYDVNKIILMSHHMPWVMVQRFFKLFVLEIYRIISVMQLAFLDDGTVSDFSCDMLKGLNLWDPFEEY